MSGTDTPREPPTSSGMDFLQGMPEGIPDIGQAKAVPDDGASALLNELFGQSLDELFGQSIDDEIERLRKTGQMKVLAASMVRRMFSSPKKELGEQEVAQIYDRINRELAVEEARADRLLRLYNL